MMSFSEILNMFNNNDIPPIMRGTKSIIKKMAVEERKIAEMNRAQSSRVYSMTRKKESMSIIFTKYVNSDFNKDLYLFIK